MASDEMVIRKITSYMEIGDRATPSELISVFCRFRWCPNAWSLSRILNSSRKFEQDGYDEMKIETDESVGDLGSDIIPIKYTKVVKQRIYKRVA